jgi:hypothetical protein
MTGHSINAEQNQEFLSTMHTMIDDLDTISSNIDEHTYLRLANGLQRLYNIHNSTIQSPNSVRETLNHRNQNRLRDNFLDNNEVEITRILARHYGRVYDSSGVLINNDITTINADAYPVNADAYPVNADAYPVNADAYPVNADAYPVNVNSISNSTIANTNDYINANYDSWNENNPAQNRNNASASANASANASASASARISYTSVTSTHWIETALREGLRSAH